MQIESNIHINETAQGSSATLKTLQFKKGFAVRKLEKDQGWPCEHAAHCELWRISVGRT